MTTIGGNVKELCTAAAAGDMDTVRFHLHAHAPPMDPNFQHPEFMTTPLIEASRFGHVDIVLLLLRYGADPTVTADFEGCTALQEALREGHHDVVDALLPRLQFAHGTDPYENEFLVLWVATSQEGEGTFRSSQSVSLIRHLLNKGHCVLCTMMDIENDDEGKQRAFRTMAESLRSETGNQKLFEFSSLSNLADFFHSTDNTCASNPSSSLYDAPTASTAAVNVGSSVPMPWRPYAVDVCIAINNTIRKRSTKEEGMVKAAKLSDWCKVVSFRGGTTRVGLLHTTDVSWSSLLWGFMFPRKCGVDTEISVLKRLLIRNNENENNNYTDPAKEEEEESVKEKNILIYSMDPCWSWWDYVANVLGSHQPWCDKVLDTLMNLRKDSTADQQAMTK